MFSQPQSKTSRSRHGSSKSRSRSKTTSGHNRASTFAKSSSSKTSHGSSSKRRTSHTHTRPHHLESKAHRRLEDDFPNLRRHRYYIRHLQRSLCKNAKAGFLSRLTPEQIAFLRLELVTNPREITSRHELLRFVSKLVKIFDRAFFYGSLERHITKIGIFTKDDDDAGRYSIAYYRVEKNELHIGLDVRAANGRRATTFNYAATVVHEMLHGFYANYECGCKFCEKRSRKGVNGRQGHENSSHGPMWLNAMRRIEQAVEKEFGNGRKFDCGIKVSLMLEMRKSRWQPRRDQFERWDVEYCEVGSREVDGWEDLVPNQDEEEEEEEDSYDLLGP